MSAPGVGDVIQSVEELAALPVGAVVARTSDTPAGHTAYVRWPGDEERCWCTDGVAWAFSPEVITGRDLPLTVVYLPGHPPRPERVVKAEALREAARQTDWRWEVVPAADGVMTIQEHGKSPGELLHDRADLVEVGDPS